LEEEWARSGLGRKVLSKRGGAYSTWAPFDGGIPDGDIWNIVNYLRSLSAQR
jgi:hypothetical protein